MPDAHAKYSASGFEAATLCPGKRVMEKGKPDNGNKYSREGTCAHQVLEWSLTEDKPAAHYVSAEVDCDGVNVTVTDDMAAAVQVAIGGIREIVGDGVLLPEQVVNYSGYLGTQTDEAWGTSDVIAFRDDELCVMDLKFGMGVEVSADDNPQMKLYALGALAEYQGLMGDFKTVRLVVLQPRIKSAPSEWTCSVDELEAWGNGEARRAVGEQQGAEKMRATMTDREWEEVYLRPNEKSCKFCKAKATCPALRAEVIDVVKAVPAAAPDEFDDLQFVERPAATEANSDWLAAVMAKADMIEDYLKAVRAEVERRLLAAEPVPGYKLVEGKQGNRAWSNKEEVEATLKAMRLKQEEMYDLSLISPTSAEKLVKAKVIGPRQWPKLQSLITRAPAKKHVAPEGDPRPAIVVTAAADDFETVSDSVHDFA